MEGRGYNSYLRKTNSPLSHESTSSSESSRADRTRITEFISRRKAQTREPGEVKENHYLPETEVSFSKDNFEAPEALPSGDTLGSSRRRKTRSPSSTSSTSTSDLQDLNAEIRRMLRGVLAQINPSTPTLHSGSYSASMILKKLKEKLEALERMGKCLDEHRKSLEAVERQTQSRLSAVKRLEDSLEAKDRAHGEAMKRIQSLEEALEEAQQALAAKSTDRSGKDHVEKMEADLKTAALQLERRTYDLLEEERELEAKEAELQRRANALSKLEKELIRRKASLDTREQAMSHGPSPSVLCRSIVEDVVNAAEVESIRTRGLSLIEELQSDLEACRGMRASLGGVRAPDEEKAELLRREQDVVMRETAVRKDAMALSRKEAELTRRIKAVEEREKTLLDREERRKRREEETEPADDQHTKAAKMWETVLSKLEHVQKAEKRLEAAKTEFLQQSQQIQEKQKQEEERLTLWEETLRSTSSGDKDTEIRLLRSELLAKDSQLQAKDAALEEQREVLAEAETALEEKSREIESIVSGISKSLQGSPRKRGSGVSEEVLDFAQTYRQRQETLRRHIDAADDEKREMCQTLKGLLSDLT